MPDLDSAIRRLPETLIDQIAAGEVVERPASVVKELIENAIDAGASAITLNIERGGKTLIDIQDDGRGMSQDDLELATERHATSKLGDEDLLNIRFLGFRGEALASIGAVARLSIETRQRGAESAWSVTVEGGKRSPAAPSNWPVGTHIQVRDLFYAVPARLKFLKADNTEKAAILDLVRRIALVQPAVAFRVNEGERKLLNLRATGEQAAGMEQRIYDVLGRDFEANSVKIDAEREGFRLYGLAGLPTYHKANGLSQHIFVNRRPLRDRALLSAVRGGYADMMHSGRHPVVALFIEIDPELVDVNVHPAKAEVRFRDAAHVRGLIVSALRGALTGELRTAGSISESLAAAFQPEGEQQGALHLQQARSAASFISPPRDKISARQANQLRSHYYPALGGGQEAAAPYHAGPTPSEPIHELQNPEHAPPGEEATEPPLGYAKAQLHSTYVIAETRDGMVMVDQHAAHERLVYERFKQAVKGQGVERQVLLIPEVLEFEPATLARLLDVRPALAPLGLIFDEFGPGALAISEVPSLIRHSDYKTLMQEIADDLAEVEHSAKLEEKLDAVASRMACHGSVRAGRSLGREEMDHLLREIEANPVASQCNHGRPTFIRLDLAAIERLFGRR